MLVLFLARLAAAARRRLPLRPGEGLLVAVVLATPLAMAVYTTRIRYRLPLDCLMFLVAAGWLAARAAEANPAKSSHP